MASKRVNKGQFYVVHFVEKPFETIDYYVCVPYHWAIYECTIGRYKKIVVAYPKRENSIVTRERVKKKEKHKEWWKFCLAELKYQTDSYDDAERWISKENKNWRLFVLEGANDTRQKVPRDQGSLGSNQKHSSKPKDKSETVRAKPYEIPQKPSLKYMDKISSNESKKQILSTTKTTKSAAQNNDPQTECSKPEQSIAIRDKQLKRNKIEETAAANGPENTEGNSQSSKQYNHKPRETNPSLPVINSEGCNKVINSNGHSQQEQLRETNGIQNQFASNSTGAPKLPSLVKETTQPNQDNNQKLRVKNIRTLTTPSNNQDPRVAHQVDNPQKNMPITLQRPLSLPLPPFALKSSVSTQQLLTANIQPGHQGPSITNKINCTPVGGMTNNFQEIVPVTEPRVVHTATSVTAPQNIPKSHQHPIFVRQDVQQNLAAPQEHMQQTHRQELPPKPTEFRLDSRLRLENRELTQHQPIRPSLNNDPTNVPSHFHQPLKIQHQAQKAVSQQDAQQSQSPVYVPILHKNNRKSPTLQGVTKTTKSSTSSKASISINQAILSALESFPMNEQETQAIPNRISYDSGLKNVFRNISALQAHYLHRLKSTSHQLPRMESQSVHQNLDQYPRMPTQLIDRSDKTNLTTERHVQDDTVKSDINQTRVNNIRSQTIPCKQEPSSPNHSTALDSGLEIDHETAFKNKMLVDESYETVSETNQTEHKSIEQLSLLMIMLEKMSVQFITEFAQINSAFQDIATRFDDLRKSIFQTYKVYRAFLDNEKIDSLENSASYEPSSKITQEVSSVVGKRQTAGPERQNSKKGNQLSNEVTVAPERIHQSDSRRNSNSTQQFALPPKYDSNDTKWTLKYQPHMAGLKELIPNTNIYVRHSKLESIMERSNCCQTLARLLLHEVFNEKALSVCATLTEIGEIGNNMSPEGRPALNNCGLLTLLDFAGKYASRCAWCIHKGGIIDALDLEIKAMRMKFGGTSRF